MNILRNYVMLVCLVGLFMGHLHHAITMPLEDLNTDFGDDVAAYSSHAPLDEEFGFDGRIVGGLVTSIAKYPYQVSLQYHNAHICGGSVVDENIILTAAHCIEEPWDTLAFRVRAGSSSHLYGGQLVGVRRIFKHEAYSTLTLDNDVALVVLDESLVYSRTVQPVQLAESGEHLPHSGNELIVSGWGLTSETGLLTPLINYVTVRLINQNTCAKSYQYIATISEKMFCAGIPQGGRDSCQGDSGGPLVTYVQTLSPSSPSTQLTSTTRAPVKAAPQLRKQSRLLKQYGIVSWGVGCAEKNFPGVYANVAVLRPWIDEKLGEINHSYGKKKKISKKGNEFTN